MILLVTWSHDYFAYAQNLHCSCLRLPRFWRIYNQFLYRHIFFTNENLGFVKCEQMDLKWTFMNLNRNKMVRLIYKSLFLESISPSNTETMIGAAWSLRYRFPHVLGHSVETWFISYHYKCHLHSWKECIRRGSQMSWQNIEHFSGHRFNVTGVAFWKEYDMESYF